AVFVLELFDSVERRISADDALDVRIQTAAGDQQQRETRTGLLVMDADGALFEKAHAVASPLVPRVGKAKRAHHFSRVRRTMVGTAQGRLCPPTQLRV